MQRWATFDCYGTLIDWNGGIQGQLERLFGVQDAPHLLERYHELEPEVQQDGSLQLQGRPHRDADPPRRERGPVDSRG